MILSSDMATLPEYWLAVGAEYRRSGLLDYPSFFAENPSVDSLAARAETCRGSLLWLGGCEPTLRRDLPELIREVALAGEYGVGLWTDGLALQSEAIIRGLKDCGVSRVRVPFHAGRSDAHDWITGVAGSSRRASRAIRLCVEAGIVVEVETIMTRPTTTLLLETVAIAKRLGARAVHLRMPRCRGDWEQRYVSLSARYGLLHPYFSAIKSSSSCVVSVRGLPQCVVPDNLVYFGVAPETWITDDEEKPTASAEGGCKRCDSYSGCSGPPRDYVERFGWYEIHSESNQPDSATAEPIPIESGAVKPPPRAGRAPATRVSFSAAQARRASLGGDPLLGVLPQPVSESIRVTFGGPAPLEDPLLGDHSEGEEVESTRVVRRRLVELAQEGTQLLRVASAGSLAHPQAADLLAECRRLSIPEVEVCGIGSSLSGLSDREIRRLRGIDRFFFALYGPDPERHDQWVGAGSFEASMTIGARISDLIKAEVGYFGVLRSDSQLAEFERGWESSNILGEPRFRLSPEGGSLYKLASSLEHLSESTRLAVVPMVPPCLFPRSLDVTPAVHAEEAFGDIGSERRKPSACDVRGAYNKCPQASECVLSSSCPGLAQGWGVERIEPVREGMNE